MNEELSIDELHRMVIAGLLMLPQPFTATTANDEVIKPVWRNYMGMWGTGTKISISALNGRGFLAYASADRLGGWGVTDKGREFLNET